MVSDMSALAYESNTDLAFDTDALRECANDYGDVAETIRTLATELDQCLENLSKSGWTTGAGKAFQKMAETNWKENMEKYADLLDTLKAILTRACVKYDNLSTDYIETTKLS